MSIGSARRAALAAQGFSRARPEGSINTGHIRRVVRQLGLLQLDFVNVLVPAHQLVLFSRLGPFDTRRFDKAIYGNGQFTEHWAHEASIVPISSWPLLQYRRASYRPWTNSPIMRFKGRRKYLEQIIEIIEESGPLTSRDLPQVPGPKRRPGDWHRSVPRAALEYHFGFGKIAVKQRLSNFQRVYDLAERLIEPNHFGAELPLEDQRRELLRLAGHASGIATVLDLADYYRMTARDAAPRVQELVEAGELEEVAVEGWEMPAYLSTRLRVPRQLSASSLLSPFDPVVWFRPRSERLFDFHYRIEIYVPAAKRKWGYYCLPFLLGERIVARVDLKAERKISVLQVLASHPEPDIDVDHVVTSLAKELRALADWLGLDTVKVSRRGKLAQALAGATKKV